MLTDVALMQWLPGMVWFISSGLPTYGLPHFVKWAESYHYVEKANLPLIGFEILAVPAEFDVLFQRTSNSKFDVLWKRTSNFELR